MITPIELVREVIKPHVEVPVVSKVPRPRPDTFIRLDMSAVRPTSPISYQSLVIIQAYAVELEDVFRLLEAIKFALDDADIVHKHISGWDEESGLAEFADPDLPDVHRWQLTGHLYYTV